MITKDNPSVYGKLFEKANEVLATSVVPLGDGKTVKAAASERGFEAGEITSIDGYFAYIDILGEYEQILLDAMARKNNGNAITATLENALKDFDPIFMCLPLDEPTFYINANTRKIEISKEFTGQQVQGDESAEIIWFSVDRYFDTTDLYNTNIYIQWEVDNNGKKREGLTPAFGRSLTIKPGQIVFGWALNQEITEAGSNVKFAVRFYVFDDKGENLIYSMSSLPSSLKINPSLNIDIEDDALVSEITVNKNHMIYQRLRASATPSLIPPAQPIIELDVYAVRENLVVQDTIDLDENGEAVLKAKAAIPDEQMGAGKIDYVWYYYDKNNKQIEVDKNAISMVYEKSTDKKVSRNDKYYELNGSEYQPVIPEAGANESPADKGWYEEQSKCVATIAGRYGISAYNRFNGSVESIHSKEADLFVIPFAVEPQFTPEETQVVISNDTGSATLKMNVTASDNGVIDGYQWFHSPEIDPALAEFTEISDAISNVLIVDGGTEDGFGRAANGLYKLQAVNTKNNDSFTKLSDIVIRVSEMIRTPVIKNYYVYKDGAATPAVYQPDDLMVFDVVNTVSIRPNFDTDIPADNYTYRWQNSADEGNLWEDVNNGDKSIYEIKVGTPGRFRCIVTATYNGQTAQCISDSFVVQ